MIHKYDHEYMFPGLATYENPLGGKIVLLAYPLDNSSDFFMGFFNIFRQIMFRNLLLEFSVGSPVAFCHEPLVSVYCNRIAEGMLLSVFNNSTDDTDSLTLTIQGGENPCRRVEVLTENGEFQSLECGIEQEGGATVLSIPRTLVYLEGLFLLLS